MLGLTNLGVTESIRLDNSGLIKMKIKSMEKKLEIRKNKYKLAGTDIFIKDDKSYKERKIDQREISKRKRGKKFVQRFED